MISEDDKIKLKGIVKPLLNVKGEVNSRRVNYIGKYLSQEDQDFILDKLSDSDDLHQAIIRIVYDIWERPVCPVCGKYTKFGKHEFASHCSIQCSRLDNKVHQKYKHTLLTKYGDENYNNKESAKETSLRLYGGHYSKTKEFVKRVKQTNLERHGNENYCNVNKIKQTKLERYGNENYSNREKFKQTNIERYGAVHYTKTKQYLEKYKLKEKEILEKQYLTKKKNHTFNSSKPEERLYQLLIENFGVKNIERQYRSNFYPYNCDFYVKSIDCYIELQGNWTHGGHPYNGEKDNEKLKGWMEKSKTSRYYRNAIETWTVRDVEKRKVAKKNNLRYIEIFDANYQHHIDIIKETYF